MAYENHSIYKYHLEITGEQEIEMPRGAKILSVQVQRGVPCLWAFVSVDLNPMEVKTIVTKGTGHPTESDFFEKHRFIGTYQLNSGDLVFHVFERRNG